jgi:hypothetical protein
MENAARKSRPDTNLDPLKLVILGATGATSLELVRMAAERGHSVTAFVRSPERLGSFMDRIEVRKGNLLDSSQLAQIVDNHDAVISAFGPRLPISKTDAHLLEQFAIALKGAMEQTSTRRVVVESVAFLFKDPSSRQHTSWADYCFHALLRIPPLWKGYLQRVASTGPWFDHPNSKMGLTQGSTACERGTFPHLASKSRERTWLIT